MWLIHFDIFLWEFEKQMDLVPMIKDRISMCCKVCAAEGLFGCMLWYCAFFSSVYQEMKDNILLDKQY